MPHDKAKFLKLVKATISFETIGLALEDATINKRETFHGMRVSRGNSGEYILQLHLSLKISNDLTALDLAGSPQLAALAMAKYTALRYCK
jgi:hypothetical protein